MIAVLGAVTSSGRLAGHEARRLGLAVLLAPPAAVVIGGVVVALAAPHGRHQLTGAVIEAVLPLGTAIAAGSAPAAEGAVELQLSLPTPYRTTLFRRIALVLALGAVLGAVTTALAAATGLWTSAHGWWPGQLAWLAPTIALGGLAVALATATGSAPFGTAAVSAAWVGEQVYKPWFAGHGWTHPLFLFAETRTGVVGPAAWAANREALLAVGAGCLVAGWLRLAGPERSLGAPGGGARVLVGRRPRGRPAGPATTPALTAPSTKDTPC